MAAVAWAMNAGASDSSLGTVAVTAADDLLTLADHGLEDGDLVAFDTLTGGADGPLEEQVHYYVRSVTTDTFQVSGSRGGNPIAFASDGGAAVYSAAPEYPAETLRQIGSHLMFHGSANALGARQGVRPGAGDPISVSGTTWTVETHTGTVEPAETTTQGPYQYVCIEQTGSLTAADGSNDRIDALDLKIEDDDADASGFRRARVVYVAGTAAGTPVPPAVTDNASRLGTITVPAEGTGDPEVDDPGQYTVASGGLLPVRGTSERPSVVYDGMAVWRQDLGTMEVSQDGAWETAAASVGYQYWQTVRFTSSGTFTKADYPQARMLRVKLVGGGGAGGGVQTTSAGESVASGGGGGGCYAESELQVSDLDASVTVTVGTGGVSTAAANGAAGGSTSFGSLVVGPGGNGGFQLGPSDNPRAFSGALSSGGGTGDLVIPGSGGMGSVTFLAADIVVEYGLYGLGGSSHLSGTTRSQRGPSSDPEDGLLYGGGGSGVVNGPSTTERAGGDGADGIVIIEIYV